MGSSSWRQALWVSVSLVVISVKRTACNNSPSQTPLPKITCFICDSAKSWDDCDKNGEEKACAANYNMCSNIYNKGSKKESYSRGCSNTGTCQLLQEACSKLVRGKRQQCEVTCCHGEKCNAPVPPQYCYTCQSRASWENCDLSRERARCSTEKDTCAKIYSAANGKGPYTKMCMVKAECIKLKGNCGDANKREISGGECDVTCCQGKLCNAASLQLVSGFIVLTLCTLIFLLV